MHTKTSCAFQLFFFFSAVNKKPTPTQPPSFSRKIKVLSFILGVCCIIAIIINFINLQSDYEEVHEFYIGFMGRKMLIQERRLTSRSYLNMLRREHLLDVEVFLIFNVSQSFVTVCTSNVVPAEIVRRPPGDPLRIFWLNHWQIQTKFSKKIRIFFF